MGNFDHIVKDPRVTASRASNVYSYGRLEVHNATHALYQQLSASSDRPKEVLDEVWLIQEHHGDFRFFLPARVGCL